MKPSNIYFHKLDSVRFWAFIIVFVSHVYFSLKETFNGDKLFAHGEIGVQIFFVLSGFLISYLTLREVEKTGTFSISHFFKKRILRIWPLYFLVVTLSTLLILISNTNYELGCYKLFWVFLGNFCMLDTHPKTPWIETLGPMWSVSVEEQFYVVFPLLVLLGIKLKPYFISLKSLFKFNIKSFIFWIFSTALILYCLYQRYVHADNWGYISYSSISALPALLSGIMLSVIIHNKEKYVHARTIQLIQANPRISCLGAFVFFISSFFIKFTGSLGVALYVIPLILATAIIIVLSVTSTETEVNVNKFTRLTRYLGQISYGLYAYHMFVMSASLILFKYIYNSQTVWFGISHVTFSLVVTIYIAQLSYTYIEKPFLKLKHKSQ